LYCCTFLWVLCRCDLLIPFHIYLTWQSGAIGCITFNIEMETRLEIKRVLAKCGLRLEYPSIKAMIGTIRSAIAITWPKVHCWLSTSVVLVAPHRFVRPQLKATNAQHTFVVSRSIYRIHECSLTSNAIEVRPSIMSRTIRNRVSKGRYTNSAVTQSKTESAQPRL
jgi:hypothetical protein